MLQHLPLATVTKKQTTWKDRMIVVTINNLWLKCYLKFYKIVADGWMSIIGRI